MSLGSVREAIESDKKYKSGRIREKNYQLILDAATAVFAQHGYKGASMMAIAEAAGLPKANIHYYFRNKSLLYSAVLERIIAEWNQGLESISPQDDPGEVLAAYTASKVRLACEQPLSSKLFASEIIAGAPYLQNYIRTELRAWLRAKSQVFEAWMGQGKMRSVDPSLLIFMIWSTTQHYADFETQVLLATNRREYDEETIERITEFVTGMILRGCGIGGTSS
ncbi:TetR/AcrR family transcriptional regulator [Microbulbifer bruguierae]|uniref:TetR/AcrR family transcriptional regulator n=1 Tax=Microbulbifer bruguierae TaxID=3029061 RepID=A0ABY8N9T1_9GAMM|nr:TetR/AcrR family transcriptional regulator [Microbulbifer bruguierae]WGL15184.1 TetR/AcrR family transcriptional regulator [Microbulbifer bruguierae]